MKKTLLVALMGLMTIASAMAAIDFQSITITLKNNEVVTYRASELEDITYVGGKFNETGAVGMKIYLKNSTSSDDYLYSQILSIDYDQQSTTVAAPTFSPAAGTYTSAQSVTITTTTSGATIYYTTNGTTPTASSTRYTGAINVSTTTTIKAIAIKDGTSSTVTTATFTINSGSTPDNNVNRNSLSSKYVIDNSFNGKSSKATTSMSWGLEYPRISDDNNSVVVVHGVPASSDYTYYYPGGVSYSLELDKSQRANRWSCFTMHDGTPDNNVGRTKDKFSVESCVEQNYQVSTNEYSSGNYTQSVTNLDGKSTTLLARGHVIASDDRQSSNEQNAKTFFTSNCHPQYQAFNGGLWGKIESKVKAWGNSSSFRDTLYVCKGATIADVTLDGSTVSGTIPYSEVQSKFGVNLTGSLTIPRYWYMAVLCLKNGTYHAMAFWSEQINSACSSTTVASCMITVDELERRTGIDFFCNLPDDIEEQVESTIETSFWNVTN